MEIEVYEYERDRPSRRFIVRGLARRPGMKMIVTAAVAEDNLDILNSLDNGKTLKLNVSDILGVRLERQTEPEVGPR